VRSWLRGRERLPAAFVVAVLGACGIGVLVLTSSPPADTGSDAGPSDQIVMAPPRSSMVPTTATTVAPAADGTESTEPPSRRGPPPAASATPTGDAVLEPSQAPGSGWLRLETSPALPEGTLEDIVAAEGLGYVAVGTDGTAPLVLHSSDGLRWARVAQDEPGLGDVNGLLRGVAVTGQGIAVIGRSNRDAAVWTSADLRTWDRVVVEGAAEGTVVLSAVASHGDRLVAAGFDGTGSGLWLRTSTGLARLPESSVERLADGQQIVRDVAWLDDGFVAVGTSGFVAAVWTSADGRRWRVEAIDAEDGVVPVAIGTPSGAVGGYTGQGGVVWNRDEAGRWKRTAMPAGTAAPQVVDGIAGSGRFLRAIGREGRSARCWQTGTGADSGVWRSCEPSLQEAQTVIRDLVHISDRWVAVGTVVDGGTAKPAIWVVD
jgi:hypothetical protein